MLRVISNILIAKNLILLFLFLKILKKNKSINFCGFFFKLLGPKTKLNNRAKINLQYVWPNKSKNEINKYVSICGKILERTSRVFFTLL